MIHVKFFFKSNKNTWEQYFKIFEVIVNHYVINISFVLGNLQTNSKQSVIVPIQKIPKTILCN